MPYFQVTVPQLDKKYYTIYTNASTYIFFVMSALEVFMLNVKNHFLSSWGTVTWCCDIKTKDSIRIVKTNVAICGGR